VLICGDGKGLAPPETCDDGPADHLSPFKVEGCLPDCSTFDSKWNCSLGSPTARSSCSPICGDGFLVGKEACDAGKLTGCKSDCSSNLEKFAC